VRKVIAGGRGSLKHVLVREYLRDLVIGGVPGAAAPSERELVHRFGVSRMTVRQAMDALVVDGLLERIPGKGTFVARPRRGSSPIASFTEELGRRGVMAESITLVSRREQAGPGVAKALGISEGDAVIHWRRLRRGDGTPVGIQDAYLNEILLPGFLSATLPSSLYDDLAARRIRPNWVEDAVAADLANAEEAELLELDGAAAVLRQQRRAMCDDRVVEVSRSVYRSDRFTFRFHLGDQE
jgi:GntR family transcriptional regulator